MKRQRFFLAAVATCAVLASCAAVCNVCLGQSDIRNTELGKKILGQSVPTNPLTDDLYDDSRLAQSTHIACIARIPYDNPKLIKLAFGLDLTEHNLIGAKITNVTLKDVNFTACDFTGADLRQAYFVRCNFSRAVLRDVKTDEYTRFIDCKFDGARFAARNFQWYPREPFDASLLTEEQLKSTDYFDKKLKPAGFGCYGFWKSIHNWNTISAMMFEDCADYDFTDIALQGIFCNLTAEQLKQTQNFQAGLYEHITFGGGNQRRLLDYKNFDFSKAILRHCTFRNVDLTGADFTDAVLYDCKFHERTIITLEQLQSTWNWKNGRVSLICVETAYCRDPEVTKAVEAQIAKEAAQASEAEASPETAPETK